MAADTRSDLQSQIQVVQKELQYYYTRLGLTPEEKQIQFQLELNLKNLEAALNMLE